MSQGIFLSGVFRFLDLLSAVTLWDEAPATEVYTSAMRGIRSL